MPVPIWPDRFIEFRDRMRASERMALFNWSKPTAPTTEQDAQADDTAAKDPDTTAEAETTPNTAPQEADPVSIHLSFSPAFGILGIPHYGDGTAESETSSQRHIWWDYDNEDESYGSWCSKERWHHVFCTRPGLTNTGKRLVTTTLGLVVILALALTALGKIRHRNRVSDMIPESLEGKRCETMAWKEFVAFMNPESFGIRLPQNWPSLCSSCIEISRNRFVYRTTVRVLGDLSQFDPATFNNLTEYDSVNAIQSMKQLRVQFRFVLCED
ncbi:hypothetical protein BGZ81_005807 [Podila clonocystis]|nr:hypothetical protein BGZ81_005807 [Podila clonocystis]